MIITSATGGRRVEIDSGLSENERLCGIKIQNDRGSPEMIFQGCRIFLQNNGYGKKVTVLMEWRKVMRHALFSRGSSRKRATSSRFCVLSACNRMPESGDRKTFICAAAFLQFKQGFHSDQGWRWLQRRWQNHLLRVTATSRSVSDVLFWIMPYLGHRWSTGISMVTFPSFSFQAGCHQMVCIQLHHIEFGLNQHPFFITWIGPFPPTKKV